MLISASRYLGGVPHLLLLSWSQNPKSLGQKEIETPDKFVKIPEKKEYFLDFQGLVQNNLCSG